MICQSKRGTVNGKLGKQQYLAHPQRPRGSQSAGREKGEKKVLKNALLKPVNRDFTGMKL